MDDQECECCGNPGTDSCPVFNGDGLLFNVCFTCCSEHADLCEVCGFFWTKDCFEHNGTCENCWFDDSDCDSIESVSDISEAQSDWEEDEWIEVGR